MAPTLFGRKTENCLTSGPSRLEVVLGKSSGIWWIEQSIMPVRLRTSMSKIMRLPRQISIGASRTGLLEQPIHREYLIVDLSLANQ